MTDSHLSPDDPQGRNERHPPHARGRPALDPAELEALRAQLIRFARMQLRQDAAVEDVVQDTLIALIEHPDRFAGQSSLKTYAIGILKHKIVDVLRRGRREVALHGDDDDNPAADLAALDALFDETGHFRERPSDWGDPDASFERKQFFEILQLCIDRLPAKIAQIFMMREWLELETEEICQELGITATNAWVMLYRARMRLRECLQLNWFGVTPAAGS
jgi:RNA polymerase sigma-70 factor (ECF subfamily)